MLAADAINGEFGMRSGWCGKAMRICRAAGMLAALVASGASIAQPYPAKPVRVIVPFSAGSAIDVNARVVGQKLAEMWGQQVVIDNRVGANSIIGVEAAAKSAPDGYTLVMANDAALAMNPSLYPKLPYDPVKDFAPIALIGFNTLLLVAHPSVPVDSVQALIQHARDRNGDLNYGSGGNGSAQHLPMEIFMAMTGVTLTHVPYKGVIPAVNDLIAGQIPVMFAGTPGVLPHVRAGRLRALAIASSTRSAVAPDIPTVAEAGVAGFHYAAWVGYLAPAGTPAPVIRKLNADVVRAMGSPDVKDKLGAVGFDIQTGSSDEFGKMIASEIQRLGKVVRDAGIKANP
ncbi:MAG: Bug family tripartite tricarboxylate transporter substrate binding protein [Burkholderiales bacterium]